jgi:pantetheine-phosphate adenylyltransferase
MIASMNVCLGGTFYPLHNGHKALLRKAFQIAGQNGSVLIGLTSDTMAKTKGTHAPFKQRKKTLENFIVESNTKIPVTIQPLFDAYGPSIDGNFDAIVVSPETHSTAEEINRKRKNLEKQPLRIIVVPFVLADDNKPISSTRIRNKEINENGTIQGRE